MLRQGNLLTLLVFGVACAGQQDPRLASCSAECAEGIDCVSSAEDARGICEANAAAPALALVEGFGVADLMLTRVPNSRGQGDIDWTPPGHTRIVECAVFVCTPLFALAEPGPDGVRRPYIKNFEQCSIATKAFSKGIGPLVFGELKPRRSDPASLDLMAKRLVTRFDLGCWAFDATRVIAASSFQALVPSEVPPLGIRIVSNCGARDDGANCPLSVAMGTCRGGECRYRCLDDQDCQHARARKDRVGVDPADGGLDKMLDDPDALDLPAVCVRPEQEGAAGTCDLPAGGVALP
jgi:hypothetical protein